VLYLSTFTGFTVSTGVCGFAGVVWAVAASDIKIKVSAEKNMFFIFENFLDGERFDLLTENCAKFQKTYYPTYIK
jgi:hypothetical protein